MYLSSTNIFQNNEDMNNTFQLPPFINFDFIKSHPLISPDNSFALFYDDSVLINIDLKTKKIKWYKKFPSTEKISNIQITLDNQIFFIKKLNTHNEIISLTSNNMNYNELKIKENIIAFKPFENSDSNDIFVINDYFGISLYKDNIMQKSISRNIINDVPNGLIQLNNKIVTIEYLSEQKLFLLFFDNGLIVVYSLINNLIENEYENEDKIQYINYIDLNFDEDGHYLFNNFIIHINNYICYNINKEPKNEIMEIEINNNEEEKEEQKNSIATFLIICANQSNINRKKSSIYFFKVENGIFSNFKNKINFDNKEIIDSTIFKYKLNNDENDMSDVIFILFKHYNILNNNKFRYSTEYSDLIKWFNLEKNKNYQKKFEIFKFFDEYPNCNIFINSINLSDIKKKIFNISYLKLGEKMTYFEQNNENLEIINDLTDLLKSNNYNDYVIQFNSPNFDEEEFKESVINKYKELYGINLEEEIFKIKNGFNNYEKDDISKINYFLLNLTANQALFKIKNNLLKRNALNNGFIFPINQICLTCKILLNSLKNKMKNEEQRNHDLEKLFTIIINILNIIKNRNRTYNDKLFGGEKEIILEQESIINSIIFDTSMSLFISKIQNLYKDSDNNINNEINENKGDSFYNIFSLQNEEDMNNNSPDDKIMNNIKELHSIYFDLFNEDNLKKIFNSKYLPLDSFLYLMKFIIYNQYFYYTFPLNKNENDLTNFKSILNENKSYNEISTILYLLDNSTEKHLNIDFYPLIKFIQYITNEHLTTNDEVNKIIPLNKIIYKLIKSLYDCKYFNEAIDFGNSLISLFSTFDEFNIYLITILELKDYPLAYSFINNCLLLFYKNEDSQDLFKKFFESDNYYEIKNLYFNFYEYLIRHKAIDVLFKLPLNFIEIYLFKEICEENEQYKEFLIIYYLIIGNINEAKFQFQMYLNSNLINESQSKILYANLIKYYETLMNKKTKKEKIDYIIDQLSKENKFLMNIDDVNEKRIIEQKENMPKKEDIAFSDYMLKSSIMENKLLSGTNHNMKDYKQLSSNLLGKFSGSFNKNLSKNILNKEKKIKNSINNINSFHDEKIDSINNDSNSNMDEYIISTKVNNKNNY